MLFGVMATRGQQRQVPPPSVCPKSHYKVETQAEIRREGCSSTEEIQYNPQPHHCNCVRAGEGLDKPGCPRSQVDE